MTANIASPELLPSGRVAYLRSGLLRRLALVKPRPRPYVPQQQPNVMRWHCRAAL